MGVYYNPVEDITNGTVGDILNTHNYDEAIRQLPPKHHMISFQLVALPEDAHKRSR